MNMPADEAHDPSSQVFAALSRLLLDPHAFTPMGAGGTRRAVRKLGAGGFDQIWRLFRCVGRVEGGGFRLGSCTLLPGRQFALTVSHIVAKAHAHASYKVVFPTDVDEIEGVVRKIHWSSGESYDCSSPNAQWPTAVSGYRDNDDRLVLLELSGPPADKVDPLPYLPAGREPIHDDRLIIAGFGEDESGNHCHTVWVATSRFRERDPTGFGVHAPRRDDLLNGMPRAGDSGGPVFWPPMSNPFEQRYLRLAGVHSERISDPNTGRASSRFVRIDRAAAAWIRATVQRAGAAVAARTAPRTSTVSNESTHGTRQFCLREDKTRTFYRFNDPPKEIDGVKMKLILKGPEKMFKDHSDMRTDVVSDPAGGYLVKLSFVNETGQSVVRHLQRSTACGGGHWYTDDPDPTSRKPIQDCYYLYLMSDLPKPPPNGVPRSPLVLLEAYAKDSSHARPTTDNIFEPNCKNRACANESTDVDDLWTTDDDQAPDVRTPDQDDEGNGHETP